MKKMLIAFMAGITITAVVPSFAQTTDTKVVISGTVKDDPGFYARLPFTLENVMVRLYRLNIVQPMIRITPATDSAITDSNGKFKLTAVSNESYKITFECKNYISTLIDIIPTQDTSLFVSMPISGPSAGNELIVTPPNPLTKDSIQFELIISDRCCATVYRDHKVEVTDSSVVLNYTFDDRLCSTTMCFISRSSTTFVSKPLKAGEYNVYKCGQYYCPPGSACPAIYYTPELVGQLFVNNGTGTVRVQLPKKSVPYVISQNQIQFSAVRNAHLSIDCFTLSGAYAGSIYNGVVKSDNASVSLSHPILNRLNQKTVVLRISLDGVVRSELFRK